MEHVYKKIVTSS